jgi:hypothetical protein
MSSRTRYARYVLDRIQRDPDLPALKSTVSNAASALVAEAAAQARSSGVSVSAGDVEAAAGYYRPVVMQLCEAALRFHLQVQGTADTTLVYVPGERHGPLTPFAVAFTWFGEDMMGGTGNPFGTTILLAQCHKQNRQILHCASAGTATVWWLSLRDSNEAADLHHIFRYVLLAFTSCARNTAQLC